MGNGGSGTVSGSSGGSTTAVRSPALLIKASDGTSDPDRAVPAGQSIQLRAVPPSGVTGNFQWRTRSRKVGLSNTETHTVTATGRDIISVGTGERIAVAFRATDGSVEAETSIQIKVIKVEFRATRGQNYGYDNMDNATGVFHHLSVKKNYHTTVQVRVTGGVDGSILRFVPDNTSTATVTAPSGNRGANFNITVNGGNTNKAETSLKARTYRNDGPLAALLKVNVYSRKSFRAKIAKIADSRSAGTSLARPSFSASGAATTINSWYKVCVGRGTLTDHSSSGGSINVRYDLNNDGILGLEPGAVSPEQRAINGSFNPSGQKIAIVKDLKWTFFLESAGSIGDNSITLKSSYTASYMKYIVVGNTYKLGTGSNEERITVLSRSSNRVALTSTLTKAHPTTDAIMWPLGGLSGNPIWIKEGSSTATDVKETIAHECGHSIFTWKDVNSPTSVMHFSTGNTDNKLRFKNQPKKYETGNENQWNKVPRS